MSQCTMQIPSRDNIIEINRQTQVRNEYRKISV